MIIILYQINTFHPHLLYFAFNFGRFICLTVPFLSFSYHQLSFCIIRCWFDNKSKAGR